MKTTSIILFLLAVTIKSFAFGGGHDSLLFDGAVNYKFPKNADCKIKLSNWRNVTITSYTIEKTTSCGEVFTEKKEKKYFVDTEMDVPEGSQISTDLNGFAVIRLDDGSFITLGHSTKIVIDESFCHKNRIIKLFSGSIWQNIKKMFEDDPGYLISTERATMGVRGTQFSVEIIEENGNKHDVVKVYEGKVEVTPILNDETNKLVIKAYEKLIEDMQSGKITADEYSNKIIKMNEIMEGSRQFPSVMVEAGNMVEVTYEVSEIKTIPADNDKWFEDPKFNR
jgi:hypothetical protein